MEKIPHITRIVSYEVPIKAPVKIRGGENSEYFTDQIDARIAFGEEMPPEYQEAYAVIDMPASLVTETGILVPLSGLSAMAAAIIALGEETFIYTNKEQYIAMGRETLVRSKQEHFVNLFDKYHNLK